MKLATCDVDGVATPALVVRADGREVVADIGATLRLAGFPGEAPQSVLDILGRWPELSDPLRTAEALIASGGQPAADLAAARLLPPVGPGQLIVCCGFNYAAHEAEVGGSSVGATWFIKNANATTGSGAPIVIPPDNANVIDYEGELAVVIGRYCHRVPAAEALGYVAGYTLINDVSARLLSPRAESTDDIKRSVIDSHLGKQYPSFCPIGPALLTADEVPDPSKLSFTTSVNGVVVQEARLQDMRLGVPELIEWLSSVFAFQPGDVISTGSPAGSGVSQDPPRFLRDADVVTISAPGIGELSNEVRMAAA
jgi:2-keto-4-pentenoate hydratase/2-oxohepta-3-ene-1,7-dioic acid hydratase in catechol pathway